MRFIHFAAAAFFVATGIVRVYWLFAGNKFERLPALFPLRGRDWGNMWKQVKFYLMIQPEKAPHYLGHNPLQQLSYTGIYLLTLTMVVTGFAMYGQSNPGGFFYSAFNWVGIVLGRHAGGPVRPPRADLGFPDLHPDPHLPGDPGRPPRTDRGDLLHHQRRPVRDQRTRSSWSGDPGLIRTPPLVLGLGNPLMGDDGLGLAVLERLREEWEMPVTVELVDGGTWGMNLLPLIEDPRRLLLIDAIRLGRRAGRRCTC